MFCNLFCLCSSVIYNSILSSSSNRFSNIVPAASAGSERESLQSIKYKKVFPTNTIYYNDGRELHYTSRPTGQVAKVITDVEDISEARKAGLEQILLDQQQNAEIDMNVTKCYDIGLGTLVFLDVPDDDVYGPHRVVGKKLTFGKRMTCSLKLNKKPIKVSDYIQQ